MSSVPADDRSHPVAPSPEPGWQVRTGLNLHQAEDLLDYLEASGVTCREIRIEAGGVTVRWRAPWPRLVD
jgi:hypothetical protein